MALQDLISTTDVEELTRLQQQLRLQSLEQLQLLRQRQTQYKNHKHAGCRNDLTLSHCSMQVKNSSNNNSSNYELSENASSHQSRSSNLDSKVDTGWSTNNGTHPSDGCSSVWSRSFNTDSEFVSTYGKGKDSSSALHGGLLGDRLESGMSARDARQKLASSTSRTARIMCSDSSVSHDSRNGCISNEISDSRYDEANKFTNGEKSLKAGVQIHFGEQVESDNPSIHKSAARKSTGNVASISRKLNGFDSSYEKLSDSLTDINKANRSCTPDKGAQSVEGTPKSILRHRQLIDRNVHVQSKFEHTPTTKRSHKIRSGLNYSYSDVDDNQFVVNKSKSVNFDVGEKVNDGNESKNPGRSTAKRVLEQGNMENISSADELYYTATTSLPRTHHDETFKSNVIVEPCKKISFTTSDTNPGSEAPANLLVHAGNDRRNARVVCDLDKRSRSSMFSDSQTAAVANESVHLSTGGSFTEYTSSNKEYSKLLTDRDRKGPLLGYDWIAGVVDNEQSLANIPDDCFDEVREFRRLNKEACVGSYDLLKSYEIGRPITPEIENPSHTCIHGYTVNERLFTEPVNVNEKGCSVCPVCLSAQKEPTAESPGFVRVSIPQKTLEKPYKIKPHRRRSFDANDSCALSKHCLAGWQCSHPSVVPTASNLDLLHAANGLRSRMITTEDQVRAVTSDFSKTSRLIKSRPVYDSISRK